MTSQHDKALYGRASGPVMHSTLISTGAKGLSVEEIRIKRGDVDMPAYIARPSHLDGAPVVLVICEAFGPNEHIRDIARRFAHQGYLAIAPDLMIRQGDALSFEDFDELLHGLLLQIPDAQVMGDLDACVEWCAANNGDVSRLAATGFCWGGRWTWLYAAHRAFASAVSWYGILDGKSSGLFPKDAIRFPAHPIELTERIQTPTLGLYAGKDKAIPVPTIERMESGLADGSPAARISEIKIYPDVGHAFFADYRESYDRKAATDGWERCLAWIARSLSAP